MIKGKEILVGVRRSYEKDDPTIRIELPVNAWEMEDALERARITDINDCKITIMKMPHFPKTLLSSDCTLDDINFLAERLAGLNESQQIILCGLARIQFNEYTEELSWSDAINLTYNLDTCCITDNVANVEELGRLAVENGMVDVQESPEHLLDYSKIGEAKRENENGVFIRNCYIMRSSELEQIYNGIPIPPKQMPHAVELDLCGSSGEKDTLRLPCDVETLREKLEKLGGTNPYSCEVTNCRCRVPIRSHEIMDIKRIYEVNELAGKLTDMDSKDLCKYKALLERRKPREIATLLALTHELNRYELQSSMNTPAHYAHAFLEQKLGVQEAQELVRCADLDRYGRILLQRDDVECTAYGLLYERGQRLQMKELETLKFYSPLVIRLDPLDEYGGMTYGDYEPIGPDFDLLSYEKAIQRSIERENRTIDPTRGLMSDFNVEDALPGVMEKVKRLFFGIEEHGGNLWGVTEAKILAPLTEDETASLLNFAEGQMADGFGKEWEHQRIETPEGDIFVSLWNPDNFQMIPEAEFAPGQSIDYDYSGGMKF